MAWTRLPAVVIVATDTCHHFIYLFGSTCFCGRSAATSVGTYDQRCQMTRTNICSLIDVLWNLWTRFLSLNQLVAKKSRSRSSMFAWNKNYNFNCESSTHKAYRNCFWFEVRLILAISGNQFIHKYWPIEEKRPSAERMTNWWTYTRNVVSIWIRLDKIMSYETRMSVAFSSKRSWSHKFSNVKSMQITQILWINK